MTPRPADTELRFSAREMRATKTRWRRIGVALGFFWGVFVSYWVWVVLTYGFHWRPMP
jgi:hypothetical protein